MADCRAKKSGLGYAVEKKLEDNYDRDEAEGIPRHVVNWINKLGAMAVENYKNLDQYDWKSICTHLKDGVLLCKIINLLLKSEQKKEVKITAKVNSPFQAMTNIENFNEGCTRYGMSKEFQFQSGDLWEVRKGPFHNVINALGSLGFTAKEKKFKPEYEGEIRKYLDRD